MKTDYYVYTHKTLNGVVFYIGKGRSKRAFSKNSRNKEWHERAKGGFTIDFHSTDLTENQAKSIEYSLIRELPNLVNVVISREDPPCKDYENYFVIDSTSPSGLSRVKGVSNGRYEKGKIGHCGHIDKAGNNWTIKFKMRMVKVHRVIWELTHGVIPDNYVIDHIDGDSLNNSIDNLRAVSSETNSRNRCINKNNSTGVAGVSFRKNCNCYQASWMENDRLCTRSFSANKYGNEEAFRLAYEWRKEQIELLNLQGAGYTERHGT